MKKIMLILLALSSYAYADDAGRFNHFIQTIHAHRLQMESKLGLDPQADIFPYARSYYDDLEDHYEHDQLTLDELGELPSM